MFGESWTEKSNPEAVLSIDTTARDQRMARGVGEVLKSYTIRGPEIIPPPAELGSEASGHEAGASGLTAATGESLETARGAGSAIAKRPGGRKARKLSGPAEEPQTPHETHTEASAEPGAKTPEWFLFQVSAKEGHGYDVVVDPQWGQQPRCSCPDFARNAALGSRTVWCKHVVAVLMSRAELRCQLLDLYL